MTSGTILMDTATEKYLRVIRGVAAKGHALHSEPIFLASIVRKRMFMSKVYTTESILGWASLISTQKEHLFGVMEHRLTSIIGRIANQTTFTMRIVFMFLVYLKITDINGTTSTAQTVTDLLARKVRVSD